MIRPWPLPFTRSACPPFIALGSIRSALAHPRSLIRSFFLSLSSLAQEGTTAYQTAVRDRRGSAFHSFGRLSLKIFAFDRAAAALSRYPLAGGGSGGSTRVKERRRGGGGWRLEGARVEGNGTERERGLKQGVKRDRGRGGRGGERGRSGKGRGRLWPSAGIRRVPTNWIRSAWVPDKVSTRHRSSCRARAHPRPPPPPPRVRPNVNNARSCGGFNVKADERGCRPRVARAEISESSDLPRRHFRLPSTRVFLKFICEIHRKVRTHTWRDAGEKFATFRNLDFLRKVSDLCSIVYIIHVSHRWKKSKPIDLTRTKLHL